jgi:predicted transcriptional regulator
MEIIPLFKRDVLISLHPEYASKILDGEKTVELRRKFPTATSIGAVAIFYSTSPVQAVVGYAQIKDVRKLSIPDIWRDHGGAACISKEQFDAYFAGLKFGYAVLLEGIQRLERAIQARDLQATFGILPPQSYRYIQGGCASLLSDGRIQASNRHKRRHRA